MKQLLKFLVLFTICASVACLCGCTKDRILDAMNAVMMNVGDNALTKDADLRGERKFGTDSYGGTYEVQCDDASFRERIFGGTSIERDDGYVFAIRGKIEGTEGTARLELRRDDEEPKTLFEGPGDFDLEVELGPGSAYFTLDVERFTGNIEISIK